MISEKKEKAFKKSENRLVKKMIKWDNDNDDLLLEMTKKL